MRNKLILLLGFLIILVVGLGFRVLTSKLGKTELLKKKEPTVEEQSELGSEQGTNTPTNTKSNVTISSNSQFFLEVIVPSDGTTVNKDTIVVQGRTAPDAEVFVNDTQVYPDKKGNFKTTVSLIEGENPILISAGNEFGDEEVERTVYFETNK